MSDDRIELVLAQPDTSALTRAEWLRVCAAAGATRQVEPDAARRLARRFDDVERKDEAGRALPDAARLRGDLVVLRSCFLVLAALNAIAGWLP